MKSIVVNGERCRLVPFDRRNAEDAVEVGCVIGQLFGRRVYRVLCFDGDDVIARNVRNDSLIVALTRSEVADEFGRVVYDEPMSRN